MNKFSVHNHQLKLFFESIDTNDDIELRNMVNLDSIDSVLREYLSIEEMRDAGSFFTGQKLSTTSVARFKRAITFESVILDPTCGAGNLLIECSRHLGIESSLSKTLTRWGQVLRGYDIHESFVEASKLRLVLEALSRGAVKDCSVEEALLKFSNLRVADALTITKEDLKEVTHIIMNPPFSNWTSPKVNYWKDGKVNAAGILVDHFVRNLPMGCEISAILPDVLRSGTRYELWRKFISESTKSNCEIIGRFNSKTDIDVFIIDGTINPSSVEINWFSKITRYIPISDFFHVCVGPLVGYRDPLEGPEYPFIHSKNSPLWTVVKDFYEYRKFKGRAIKPPFVVIRRTSSPSDKYRASGTIISGDEWVAVENHLIVVKPNSNKLKDCHNLLKNLKLKETNDFLNNRIRCRHLTIGIVKSIPLTIHL